MPAAYLQHVPLIDVGLHVLLGFAMLVLVIESMRRQMGAVAGELVQARERVEVLARVDPLTESLNRHAFYSLIQRTHQGGPEGAYGCAAIVELNELSWINDNFGHVTGDRAIRALARAIRSMVRADDLLFRWGGDEFLILLFGVSEMEARARLARLDQILAEPHLHAGPKPLRLTAAFGVAGFSRDRPIDRAIEQADNMRYLYKQSSRREITGNFTVH